MADQPRRYLLAVGIAEYADWPQLERVPNEVAQIVDLLTGPDFGMARILEEASADPLARGLLGQLAEWTVHADRQPTDQLVIYWSGHGYVDTGQLLLILKDTRRSTCDPAITVEQLLRAPMRSESRVGPTLLMLDVCFAGQGALDLSARLGDWTKGRPASNESQLAVVCAAQSRKTAKQEALARSFVAAVKAGVLHALEHEPYLFLDKILAETNRRMPHDQYAEIVGKYRELSFICNPNYQPNPLMRRDAIGLMSRVRRFEAEYLVGETDAPVPFGGRQSQLEHLDIWLNDLTGDPRLMIAAPAGRGKSALLVFWIESMRARGYINDETWNLAFVPVSLRFETSSPEIHFHLLALQLARICGENLAHPAADPPGFYADQCRDLLHRLSTSGKRVLIVLDALDEAVDPQVFSTVFPKTHPRTVRIVASARLQTGDYDHTGWLNRLHWPLAGNQHLTLPRLCPDQIADVLVEMGAPVDVIANEPSLVRRLAELTEGEPLVLRLYAEDLWQRAKSGAAISRADLDDLKPGFAPYFERWLELQKRQWSATKEPVDIGNVDRVLAILAAARGPLSGGDLLNLFQCIFPDAPCPPNSRTLLAPLRRFVIGDGKNSAYVLSHPRIGEAMKEGRCHDLMPVVDSGFAEWGRRHVTALNEGRMRCEDASSYALQFLRHHFDDVKALAGTFMLFVEDGWRRAWEHFEGGQRGFSTDVTAAWDAQRKVGPLAHLGAQIRCVLALSSIRSLGSTMPSKLVIASVRKGVLGSQHAQHYAERMESGEGVKTLCYLAFENADNEAVLSELINAVLERVNSQRYQFNRGALLVAVLNSLFASRARIEDRVATSILNEITCLIRGLTEPTARVASLTALVQHLPQDRAAEVLTEALQLSQSIVDEGDRAEAFSLLAMHLPPAQLSELLKYTKALIDEDVRAATLLSIAKYLLPSQTVEAMVACIECGSGVAGLLLPIFKILAEKWGPADGLPVFPSDTPSWLRSLVLAHFAPVLPPECKAAILDEAMQTARTVADENSRAEVLAHLIPYLGPDQIDQAVECAETITDIERRTSLLVDLAKYLFPHQLSEVMRLAKTVQDELSRAKLLMGLAQYLSPEQMAEALAEALQLVWKINDVGERADVLAQLADQLLPEQLSKAMQLTKAIDDVYSFVKILVNVSKFLPQDQRAEALAEAFQATRTLVHEGLCARTLDELAVHLTSDQRAEALQIMSGFRQGGAVVIALKALAPHLSHHELPQALGLARSIVDEYERTEAFTALTPVLLPGQLTEVLQLARVIVDKGARAKALGALASYLPEDRKAGVVAEMVQLAQTIGVEYVSGLIALAQHLSDNHRKDAIARAFRAVPTINHEGMRYSVLLWLAPHLSPNQLSEALQIARAITDEASRATAFTKLTQYLPPDKIPEARAEAIRLIQAVADDRDRASAFDEFATCLAPAEVEDALKLTKTFTDQRARVDTLAAVASHLSPEQNAAALAAALQTAKYISNDFSRGEALAVLVPYLPQTLHQEALPSLLETMAKLSREEAVEVLIASLEIVCCIGGKEIAIIIHQAIRDVNKWFP